MAISLVLSLGEYGLQGTGGASSFLICCFLDSASRRLNFCVSELQRPKYVSCWDSAALLPSSSAPKHVVAAARCSPRRQGTTSCRGQCRGKRGPTAAVRLFGWLPTALQFSMFEANGRAAADSIQEQPRHRVARSWARAIYQEHGMRGLFRGGALRAAGIFIGSMAAKGARSRRW